MILRQAERVHNSTLHQHQGLGALKNNRHVKCSGHEPQPSPSPICTSWNKVAAGFPSGSRGVLKCRRQRIFRGRRVFFLQVERWLLCRSGGAAGPWLEQGGVTASRWMHVPLSARKMSWDKTWPPHGGFLSCPVVVSFASGLTHLLSSVFSSRFLSGQGKASGFLFLPGTRSLCCR